MKSLHDIVECGTPGNTMGMGNPQTPEGDNVGSGDLPCAKCKKEKKPLKKYIKDSLNESIFDETPSTSFAPCAELIEILTELIDENASGDVVSPKSRYPQIDVLDKIQTCEYYRRLLELCYNKLYKKYVTKGITIHNIDKACCYVIDGLMNPMGPKTTAIDFVFNIDNIWYSLDVTDCGVYITKCMKSGNIPHSWVNGLGARGVAAVVMSQAETVVVKELLMKYINQIK